MFFRPTAIALLILFSIVGLADDRASLSIDLNQAQYAGGSKTDAQADAYTFMGLKLNVEGRGKYIDYKLTPQARGTMGDSSESYFGVTEAYISQKSLAPGFSLSLGTRLRHWSYLDEEFNVGIWQPQLRWDYLAPQQKGLTGIFFDWDLSSSVQVTLFTSPIAIPDQGPQFRLQDGEFSTGNRWFYEPQSRLQLFSRQGVSDSTPLLYDLEAPGAEELIMHSSFGMAVKLRPAGPFWLQLAYAFKPMNQIHLGLECTTCYNLATPEREFQAKIHPKIIKHNVFTLESGFEDSDRKGFLSVTADVPNPSGMPGTWEESSLHTMLFMGGAFEQYVGNFVRPLWMRYSYMKAIEFKGRKKDGILGDQVESSLDRYPYRDVASIGGKFLLSQIRSRQITLQSRYLYSIPENGGWINAGFDWVMGPATWGLSVDVLGAEVDPNSSKAGLLSRYRANDRINGGFTYAF